AELSLVVRYGYSIPKVSKAVQEKVRTAIEGMTGLPVVCVNVHIVGVDIEKA
ncbi:MAG: Asp23/Gls24 family envelope stress response protein, partial [Lachnospiraceae bacterium]|nr:Asp23/Gls24 family envelope stress response protein [Lachnospiraceae bacterium]